MGHCKLALLGDVTALWYKCTLDVRTAVKSPEQAFLTTQLHLSVSRDCWLKKLGYLSCRTFSTLDLASCTLSWCFLRPVVPAVKTVKERF